MADFDLYEYIRTSYRGISAYADSLDEQILKKIHIQTSLDKSVSKAISAGKSVVLTGNPGDGKTHLLRVLEPKIKKANPKSIVELDASEKLNDDIVKSWKKAQRVKAPFCIAINEAVLFELAKLNPSFQPVVQAQEQVANAIFYAERNEKIAKPPKSDVAVFDLSRRNVLTEQIVNSALDKFCNCTFPPECDGIYEISDHAQLANDTLFKSRLQFLFDRLVRRGFHCTLRELVGFIGFLLGKGLTPDELAESTGNAENFLTELIFSKDAKGTLFQAIRNGFDPGHICHPVLDTRIVSNEIASDTWSTEEAELFHSADVDDVEEIEARRRRFYFLNQMGEQLVNINSDVDSGFAKLLTLKSDRDVLREIIPKINRAFRFTQNLDGVRVWRNHHFADTPKHEMLLSDQTVARREFCVLYPNLSSPMSEAFEYLPNHLAIQVKDEPSTRFRIDFEMYQFLCSTELGASISSAPSHIERKLWQFMQRLALTRKDVDEEVELVIFDLETNELTQLVVDTEESRYITIESAR